MISISHEEMYGNSVIILGPSDQTLFQYFQSDHPVRVFAF